MSHSTSLLDVRNLGVSYGGTQVLRDVDIAVGHGEMVGIVGESGSGKSTLLRAIASLLPSSARIVSGSIGFEGLDLVQASQAEMRSLRGSAISYLFQNAELSFDPLFTIGSQFSEVLHAHGAKGANKTALEAIQSDALERVGFEDPSRILGSLPSELSGGMAQRVAIAFSLAGKPRLLLADEPTSALDVSAQEQVVEHMRFLNYEEGLAIVIVSHDIELVASVAKRLVVMKSGRVVESGPSEEVMSNPKDPYTRELIEAIPKIRGEMKVEKLGDAHVA